MPRFPQPIDASLHGATDYTVGTLLLTALPRLVQVEGTPAARHLRIAGAGHVGYSVFTKYPLGLVKLIPYKAHLAIDAAGAIALAAAPWITGTAAKGRRQWVPHLALAVFELTSLALSDPSGKGDEHADVGKVQGANELRPRSAIEGTTAVKAGTAKDAAVVSA